MDTEKLITWSEKDSTASIDVERGILLAADIELGEPTMELGNRRRRPVTQGGKLFLVSILLLMAPFQFVVYHVGLRR
jgi:hypothetical protein